jgi:hypothetical protein
MKEQGSTWNRRYTPFGYAKDNNCSYITQLSGKLRLGAKGRSV